MKRIAKIRAKRQISQAGLARMAGLHGSTVNAIERGRLNPYPSQLGKLAEALDWPQERAHELLEDVDQ